MAEEIATVSLQMAWSEAPWDKVVYRFPVLQITTLKILGPNAANDIQIFEHERQRLGAGLGACKMYHTQMSESMLLENRGFRFFEIGYQPDLELSKFNSDREIADLLVARNHRVLNLCSRPGFYFPPSSMTFHWGRQST